MKKLLFAAAVAAFAAPAMAADVGVSINIGQPGFYGQIDIGGAPPPRLIYSHPVVIESVHVDGPPLYLHVPRAHYHDWRNHCREYNACGRQVYFVQNTWYEHEYVPHYRHEHGDHDDHDDNRGDNDHHDNGRGHGRGHGKHGKHGD